MNSMPLDLDVHAKARGFFERDACFLPASGFVARLLKEYEKVSRRAAIRSRKLLLDPQHQSRDSAVWAEAQACALERVLCAFLAASQAEQDNFEIKDIGE